MWNIEKERGKDRKREKERAKKKKKEKCVLGEEKTERD